MYFLRIKKMKKLLISLFLLGHLYVPTAGGQTIDCESIDFSLIPISQNDSMADFKYRLHVKMYLSVSGIKNDTLVLNTNVKFAQALGPENLNAFLLQNNEERILLSSYIENIPQPLRDTQLFKIALPKYQKLNLIVSYDVIGTGLFFYIFGQSYPNVLTYYPLDEYVYPMNIIIKKARATVPDSILSFCDLRNKEVNLTFINKKHYKKETTDCGNIKLHTFIPDSIVNNNDYRLQINKFHAYIKRLSACLETPKTLNVIFVKWRDEETRHAFGRSFGNHSIFDIKFHAEGMLHEAIHQAFSYYIPNMSDGEYFMKESIIEWLTLFLAGQLTQLDTSLSPSINSNLHNTHINSIETWSLIYKTGPAILQKVALKSGEEQLASAIISFLIAKEGRETNYVEFIQHLNAYLPDNLVRKFDEMMKGGD